jgi:hydrogenase expression/formation protein HypD
MKYIDEYHDPKAIEHYVREIARVTTQDWTIMEVCGGQTHAIVKHGLDQLLPDKISLLHGPGCPVCVTSVELIDKAIEIASSEDVIFCSFGDMLRVPGSEKDLFSVRARGGDVRIVYSPLDSLKIARDNPDKEVVFFGIGFETTAPSTALTVYQAKRSGLANFSLLAAHVLIPPAIEAILSSKRNNVRGFLAAGHVCAIAGYEEYETISTQYNVPIVVTGFEPLDILQGIYMTIAQLEDGKASVGNQYSRAVQREGNREAQKMISRVFKVVDRKWRGLGEIANSGLGLSEEYADYDAEKRFHLTDRSVEESSECISGLILQGIKKPHDCPAFGTRCTPESPLGATMVSSEGACSAYYRYRKVERKMPKE